MATKKKIGFAAMSPEKRKEIQKKAMEARRKNRAM
jgi:hypothetical protein